MQPLEPDFSIITDINEYNRTLDICNMNEIDRYIRQKKEYMERGYYTAFMGLKIYEEPKEPEFSCYK